MTLRFVTDKTEKKSISSKILNSNSDQLDIPESIETYIEQCAEMPFFAAFEGDAPIVFVAIKKIDPFEINVRFIGDLPKDTFKAIIDFCKDYCRGRLTNMQ